MGKKVNLADLAREEVSDDPSSVPALTDIGPAATLPIADVTTNPLNRRADGDLMGDEFNQLVETIREHGVLQPIVVCSTDAFLTRYPDQRREIGTASWVTLIGNRRLLAAAAVQLQHIPAVVNDERAASMWEVMLVENMHRRSLGPLHEAEAMKSALTESQVSARELATRIGRTHTYVNQRLALLGLIPTLRREIEGGLLKVELARELGKLPEAEQEQIVAAGPPFRLRPRSGGNAVSTRRIAASTPQQAATSIRELFTVDEISDLIRLLSDHSDNDQ